jgi:hypothetical protein
MKLSYLCEGNVEDIPSPNPTKRQMTVTQVPAAFATEQEIRGFFAPLGVTAVRKVYPHLANSGWEVTTSSNYRAVGKFLHENGLLDRCGGSGSNNGQSFYLDHPPWAGSVPRSWLPAKAKDKDNYRPTVVATKKALVAAGFECSYLRSGSEERVKVTDDAVPFNLVFVDEGKGLQAKVLTSGQTFRNVHRYVPVTVEQAVKLTQRAAGLFKDL